MKNIKCYQVSIGAARAEGRQPSHDGEYFAVYYIPGDPAWVAEGNAGVVASDYLTYCEACVEAMCEDEDMLAEAREIDAEIERAVSNDSGDTAATCGAEAKDYMICNGWATADEFDGGWLIRTTQEESNA